MRKSIRVASYLLIAAIVAGVSGFFTYAQETQAPTSYVATDKTGYLLGDTVVIIGRGYTPGDVFTLHVVHAGGGAEAGMGHEPFTVAVRDDGGFDANWVIPIDDAAGHDYVVQANSAVHGAMPPTAFSRIATVGTDKFDYPPGDTAVITGAGFQPGETVSIRIEHSNLEHVGLHAPLLATADGQGRVTASWYVEPESSKDSLFRLTAIGEASRLVATTTFTDAFVMVVDDAGADDVSGQRDLNFMGVDAAPTTGNLGVTWGWDDTGRQGNNTMDACALFDTDADGLVNYALCASASGNPAVQASGSPRFFTCDDTAPDRCGGPNQIAAFTSTATVAVTTNADPFRAASDHTACDGSRCNLDDTVANLTVRFADFVVGPGQSIRLRNVCAYSGPNPNGSPSDCAVRPGNGFLTIRKTTTTPRNTATTFSFTTTPAAQNGTSSFSATITGSGTDVAVASSVSFAPTMALDITEAVPASWNLTSASCVVQAAAPTATGTRNGNSVTGITIQSGLETVCTFANARQNQAPEAVDDTATVNEDSANNALSLLANDSDADGDTLSIASATQPANGSVTISGGGTGLTYTPAANFFGVDSFSYTISDGNGGTDTATASVTVTAVNDAPLGEADSYSTDEDTVLTVAAPGVLANDTDVEGDALTATVATGVANGTLTLNGNGSFVYTPAANFSGSDGFTYTLSDGNGGGLTVTVTLIVRAVNDAPVAVNDSYDATEDTTLTVAVPGVLGNDTDADTGDTSTAVVLVGPAHGVLTLNADGSFTLNPTANYCGPDSFTYKANDGEADSNVAVVSISITCINDPPVAVNDARTTDEDTVLSFASSGLTSNDTDVDGDTLTLTAVGTASHGTVTLTAGQITYTPEANFFGADSFSYTVSDGNGGTATGAVSVTVNPVNDAPAAVNDAYATNEDTPLTMAAPGVVGNDTDVDGDSLSAAVITGVTHGTLSLNANGSFTYTPSTDYFGSDSFTYRVSDGNGGTATATVSLTIHSVNDAPVVTATTTPVVVNEGNLAASSGTWGDVDSATVTLTASIGTITRDGGTWSWSFLTADGPLQTQNVTVTANDGSGGVASTTFVLTVHNVAPTVSITSPVYGTSFAMASQVTVNAPFVDPGSDTWTCTIDWDGVAVAGTVNPGTKMCSGSRALTTAGLYTITVTVTDKDGGSGQATTLAVVYDPNGSVTGGGWIESPAGAYPAAPALAGSANFGFVSQYKRGATAPTGQTEFQFRVADFNFHSTAYEWLVVSGCKAQYKGTGTVNGVGGYKFLLTATDGDKCAARTVDKFRMKVTDASDQVIYDNMITTVDDPELFEPQAIAGGAISIHTPARK